MSTEVALQLAVEHFGRTGHLTPLPGEVDANFRLAHDTGAGAVLKVMHPSRDPALVEAQAGMLEVLATRAPGLRVPRVLPDRRGSRWVAAGLPDGTTRVVWMLSWLPGKPLAELRPRHGAVLAEVGRSLGQLDAALAGWHHPATRRDLRWDLTRAAWIADELTVIGDPGLRARVEAILADYTRDVLPVLAHLRRGVIHGDANDHNLLVEVVAGQDPSAVGLIDFGDCHEAPLVCELAVAATYALLGAPDPLAAIAQVAGGYHRALALEERELEVLFPLIRARLAVSVVTSAMRTARGEVDPYATISEAPAWEAIERLASLPARLPLYAVRAACGLDPVPHARRVRSWLQGGGRTAAPALALPAEGSAPLVFDLGFGSTFLGADPAHLESAALTRQLFAAMDEAGTSLGVGRYDEARPLYTAPLFASPDGPLGERRTVHLGMDLFAAAGTVVQAVLDGEIHAVAFNPAAQDYGGVILLRHRDGGGEPFYTLYGHLSAAVVDTARPGTAVQAGDAIGTLGTINENGGWAPHLHFQVITDLLELGTDFPGVVAASHRAVWRDLSPDPAPVLGLAAIAPASADGEGLAARRGRLIGRSVRTSYANPVTAVRGWRQYLFDETGRRYLDVYNNVPLVGHSHPRVVAAVQGQMALLNTNTRYLHPNLVRYAERLTRLFPDPLRVCFVLNSASEANELALRLARAQTRRRDLIVLEHAYHGHTTTLIDISPYKFDGPGGTGRPDWVHVAPLPDDYRGMFRRDVRDRGVRYAAQVGQLVERCAAAGRGIGAFIAESLPSVGGQVEFPDGYLAAVYPVVRAAGGVCIADEVQVGFGRLGTHWWGFETQGVIPDIVVLGKPIGNGFPLAAVVTTHAIADAFDGGMEFFSTFGGNPVACAAGLAVLEVLEEEGLMGHAERVGGYLKRQLLELAQRHRVIGDVRGRGLFLGIELVRNRDRLEPASGEAGYVVNRLRDLGVLCGTDGPHHNVLKIRPPLCLATEDADLLVARLDQVLAEDPVRAGLD